MWVSRRRVNAHNHLRSDDMVTRPGFFVEEKQHQRKMALMSTYRPGEATAPGPISANVVDKATVTVN